MESFKQNHEIPSDLCEDAETVSGAVSTSYTRSFDCTSPVSLQGLEPPYSRDLRDGKTFNGLKNEELDSSLSFANQGTVLEPFLRAPHLTGGTCSSETSTSGFTAAKALDISSEEGSNAIQEMAYPIRATFRTMRPPPSRAHTLPNEGFILAVVALKALQSVSSFIERQPEGFLDYQENMVFGKVMEKVKRLSRADSID
ncbi:hypothetical protein LTR49_028059 [Elasticomyces elasticus]|nr:hypothetical protein LTR49_028059 [Elasticomyces elasticus]